MDGVNGLAPAWPKLNEMRRGGRRDRWLASSRPAPRERKWIRNDIKVLLWTDQEEGNCVHNDLSTDCAFFFSVTDLSTASVVCSSISWTSFDALPVQHIAIESQIGPLSCREAAGRAARPIRPDGRRPLSGRTNGSAGLFTRPVQDSSHGAFGWRDGAFGPGCNPCLQITTQLNRAAVLRTNSFVEDRSRTGPLGRTDLRIFLSANGLARHRQCKQMPLRWEVPQDRWRTGEDDGKTGAWIAMFWDGAKTDSRLTIPAARLRAASPPNMLRERQSTSRAYQTFGSIWKENRDISSDTSDGPERASVGLEEKPDRS
ncbi:hypothetical protein CFIO01_04382 [Colletotrichum fioriniae PJ7]|uniref:Uncharacterized protein n=1 Tax=Colletotrichum fioriniae PJ7 TaxID=1445577 RepID=A0A010RCP2_9PEZI|nr:hypothetical protein CFIO01_04382 [Colletotrichum fioriniae PJ7]